MYIVRHNVETGRRSSTLYNLCLQIEVALFSLLIRGILSAFLRSGYSALFFFFIRRKTRNILFRENIWDLCPVLIPSPPI